MKGIKKLGAFLNLHFAVLLFGMAGLFAKWVPVSPWHLVLGRTLFASAVLLVVILIFRIPILRGVKRDFPLFIIQGWILVIHWWSFFYSIQKSNIATGLFGFSTFPVFVIVLEWIVLRAAFRRRHAAMALLAIIGMVLILPPGQSLSESLIALGAGIFSGFSFAVLTLINKQLVERYSPLGVSFFQQAIAASILAIFGFRDFLHLPVADLQKIALLGVVCTALAHTLFISTMKYLKARTVSVTALMEPVYGVLLGLILLHEPVTALQIPGGLMILMAGVVIYLEE